MRTGRRHLLRDSFRKTAAATPERQRPQQRQADLLDRADDGVRTATLGGVHDRRDAPLVLDEEREAQRLQPLDQDVADQQDQRDEHDECARHDDHRRDAVLGHQPAEAIVGDHGEDDEEHDIGAENEAERIDSAHQPSEDQPVDAERADHRTDHASIRRPM